MDHVHFDGTKNPSQVTEPADESLNTSINESLQLFKPKVSHAVEIIQDKKIKRSDIDAVHDYIMKRKHQIKNKP